MLPFTPSVNCAPSSQQWEAASAHDATVEKLRMDDSLPTISPLPLNTLFLMTEVPPFSPTFTAPANFASEVDDGRNARLPTNVQLSTTQFVPPPYGDTPRLNGANLTATPAFVVGEETPPHDSVRGSRLKRKSCGRKATPHRSVAAEFAVLHLCERRGDEYRTGSADINVLDEPAAHETERPGIRH